MRRMTEKDSIIIVLIADLNIIVMNFSLLGILNLCIKFLIKIVFH